LKYLTENYYYALEILDLLQALPTILKFMLPDKRDGWNAAQLVILKHINLTG
jgi:hypothetical protein